MSLMEAVPTSGNRAVSPVIGVILMVAITVILAAVIGAFVLEIGDQQETAPSTSFDSEQTLEYYRSNWAFANLTTVEIAHAGGNVVDGRQVEVKVEGNDSVWGSSHDGTDDNTASETRDEGYPVPDIRPTLGSNEPVEFSSGESWRFHSYNAIADERLTQQKCDLHYDNNANNDDPEHAYKHKDRCSDYGGNRINFDPLQQGNKVNVVWTASSGGKTQTLFKYTVQ